MGWDLPPRGKAIRVICCETARISSHLLGLGAMALDLGAMTAFLYTFTEREKLYNLFELLTGARFTTSYTRVGGQIRDLPDTFIPALEKFLDDFIPQLDEVDKLLTRNRIFVDRTRDVGVIPRERAIAYALSGPNLRGSGIEHDLRRSTPISITRNTTSMSSSGRQAIVTIVIWSGLKRCAKAPAFCAR
jgi:NADH:ubiquinone oxidoreductase 49 kD subunit 7